MREFHFKCINHLGSLWERIACKSSGRSTKWTLHSMVMIIIMREHAPFTRYG